MKRHRPRESNRARTRPGAGLRPGAGNAALEALGVGVVMGFGAFFLRLGLAGMELNLLFLAHLLLSPFAWLGGALSVLGFLGMQKALSTGRVAVVMPLLGGLSVLVPVALAAAFLGEALGLPKAVGIALILLGIAGIAR